MRRCTRSGSTVPTVPAAEPPPALRSGGQSPPHYAGRQLGSVRNSADTELSHVFYFRIFRMLHGIAEYLAKLCGFLCAEKLNLSDNRGWIITVVAGS